MSELLKQAALYELLHFMDCESSALFELYYDYERPGDINHPGKVEAMVGNIISAAVKQNWVTLHQGDCSDGCTKRCQEIPVRFHASVLADLSNWRHQGEQTYHLAMTPTGETAWKKYQAFQKN